MKRRRRNSDNDTYQFGIGLSDSNAMTFGEPPYSLDRYEQSSNTAGDITDALELYDKNNFWVNNESWDFKGPYKI